MATIKLLSQRIFGILLRGDERKERRLLKDVREVIRELSSYNKLKDSEDAVVVESSSYLSRFDKEKVLDFLHLPEETRIIHYFNPTLMSSFQIIYKGKIYSFKNDNLLFKLKVSFLRN